jgi:hypothetical protein
MTSKLLSIRVGHIPIILIFLEGEQHITVNNSQSLQTIDHHLQTMHMVCEPCAVAQIISQVSGDDLWSGVSSSCFTKWPNSWRRVLAVVFEGTEDCHIGKHIVYIMG